MSEINKPNNGIPVVFDGLENKVSLPAFIVPNKEQIEVIIRDAGTFDVINANNVDAAELFLKAAKAVNKEVTNARLAYTRQLDNIKELVMTTEKEIIGYLNPIEAGIKAEKQRQYDAAKAEKARLQKLEDERIAAELKETQRKADLANKLVKLENDLTETMFGKKTLEELNAFCNNLKNGKAKEEMYQERTADAQAIIQKVLDKKLGAEIAIANAEEAEKARKQREEEAKQRQEEVNRIAAQELLKVATDSDLRTQVATQSVAEVKGIKVKKVAQIVDATKIPRAYLVPDMKLINQAIAEDVEIPGVIAVDEVGRSGR